MYTIQRICLVLAVLTFTACEYVKKEGVQCKTREECLNDPNCLCWCSQICGYRKKEASDHPTYIEDDRYGKFCYCKQWDFDHYEDNCIHGKNIKEPKDAK